MSASVSEMILFISICRLHPVFVSGAKSTQKVQNVCWFTRRADEGFEVKGFELKDGFLESVGIRCDVLELVEAVFAKLV
jgi:hypothetical protein